MTDEKKLKPIDANYWVMVRILWENDYQLGLKEAAVFIATQNDYAIPSEGTLRSKKLREEWEKKNDKKSITRSASAKADSNILIDKTNKKRFATHNGKKKNRKDATPLQENGNGVALNSTDSVATPNPTTQIISVEENNRESQISPVHDSDAIDLRADVLTRHRLQWPRLEQRLISGLDLLESAGNELVQIADAVLGATLLDSEDDEKDKEKKMSSARVKAAKLKMYVAEKRVNVVVEAIRGVVVAQASERISWTMDDYNEEKPDNHTHNEAALDEHYKELEAKAQIEKEEMRLRSLTIRTVGNKHKDDVVLIGQKQNSFDDDED